MEVAVSNSESDITSRSIRKWLNVSQGQNVLICGKAWKIGSVEKQEVFHHYRTVDSVVNACFIFAKLKSNSKMGLKKILKFKQTRPNEFGSMTARKDDTIPIKSIFYNKKKP